MGIVHLLLLTDNKLQGGNSKSSPHKTTSHHSAD